MTTFGEAIFECPICGEKVPGKILHSTNQMGQDTDFCPVTVGFHAVPLLVHACRNCGYAGYTSDFEEKSFKPEVKIAFLGANIAEGLIPLEARLDDLSPDHFYYLAAHTARHFKAAPEQLGDLLLRASWCLRLEGGRPQDEVAASRYRREAIQEFHRALESGTAEPGLRRTFIYLLAELNRREGNFEEAEKFFKRFLEEPIDDPEWVTAAVGLRQRCQAKDASNFTFEEVIRVMNPPD
ncbi:MAG: DUF2225 domain-containing protein [Planctomycetota bacterium]|jgi:hypothetical protein